MASLEGATHDDTQAQMDRRPHPIDDNTTYAASAQQLEAADTEGETAGAGPLQDPATDEGPASAAASSAVASVAKDTSGLVSFFAENTVSNAATEAATAGAGAGAADHPEVDHTAVPAAPPAPAVAVDENMVLDVQLTGQFLKQNGEQIAAAPAITTSPARNSSTADPTVQEVAPAGASDNEAAADPPVIHASSSDTATQDAPAVNVRELREHLSATRIPLTAQMAPPPKAPSPQPKPQPALPVSEHDTVNTVNVAALLASADFKKVPGQDVIPYEDLITLRLEDGIDVTRKEEYLSSDDFTKVFGCNREAYAQMPQWKRLQIKRSVKLF